jgi:hypothetical protein
MSSWNFSLGWAGWNEFTHRQKMASLSQRKRGY